MQTSDWQSRLVPVFAGQGDTHIETGEDYSTRSLAAIFAMHPTNRAKSRALAFIPSLHAEFDARCHAVQRERGQFVALTGDVDKGDHSLEAVQRAVCGFIGDAAVMIYSSAHARPGNRRWRYIVPLAEPVGYQLWHDAQTVMFDHFDAQGVAMDRALDRAGQPVYLPNVPNLHADTGVALRDGVGRPLYFASWVRAGAPGLRLDSEPMASALVGLARQREADERRRARLREAAERRLAKLAMGNSESPIPEFNRSAAIADLLVAYGYEQSLRNPDDWRSPQQTSASFATRVIDAGKWVSLSASDADSGLGARCASGCFGDAFDLFVHFEHGGDRKAALRTLYRERRDERAFAQFGRPLQNQDAI